MTVSELHPCTCRLLNPPVPRLCVRNHHSRRRSLTDQDKAKHRNADDLTYERVAGSLADRRAAKGRGKDREYTDEELEEMRIKSEKEKEKVIMQVVEPRCRGMLATIEMP